MDKTGNLRNEISHCPLVEQYFSNPMTPNPCSTIIGSQNARQIEDFQVPEPWNGKIVTARILFLSSNPSLDEQEMYPRWSAKFEVIEDFFAHRFDGTQKTWVLDGKRGLRVDGSYGRATPYWSEIRKRAGEILGREAVSGVDYALTEVVHCKSKGMVGVPEAAATCIQRYLGRVLEIATAQIVAVMGDQTRKVLEAATGIASDDRRMAQVGEKLFLFMPAPGSNKPRRLSYLFTIQEIEFIRSTVQ